MPRSKSTTTRRSNGTSGVADATDDAARPVLKWAGGKTRLLPKISTLLPDEIDTYYEPFVGGAAVFFHLAAGKRFKRAVLSDRNRALVEVYQALRKDVEAVIRLLGGYTYDRDEYYLTRSRDPEMLDLNERAARLIYLNKTGYNGLYRVNRKGKFNVPFGRYDNPRICDEARLRAAARVLKRAKLEVCDFQNAVERAGKKDAVYFDPPYVPLSSTASFTAYHSEEFGKAEHERLAETFGTLAQRGVPSVLSNSDTPYTRQLYREWVRSRVRITRPINSRASGRGEISELLVLNRPART